MRSGKCLIIHPSLCKRTIFGLKNAFNKHFKGSLSISHSLCYIVSELLFPMKIRKVWGTSSSNPSPFSRCLNEVCNSYLGTILIHFQNSTYMFGRIWSWHLYPSQNYIIQKSLELKEIQGA